jgi:hypothetical protein
MDTLIVRPPMTDDLTHPCNHVGRDGCFRVVFEYACDSTHDFIRCNLGLLNVQKPELVLPLTSPNQCLLVAIQKRRPT